jgi:hypothetical protein
LLPPSVADGERRDWYGGTIAPAVIEAVVLRTAVTWLAIGCLVCVTSARRLRAIPARTFLSYCGKSITRLAAVRMTGSVGRIPTRRGAIHGRAGR